MSGLVVGVGGRGVRARVRQGKGRLLLGFAAVSQHGRPYGRVTGAAMRAFARWCLKRRVVLTHHVPMHVQMGGHDGGRVG